MRTCNEQGGLKEQQLAYHERSDKPEHLVNSLDVLKTKTTIRNLGKADKGKGSVQEWTPGTVSMLLSRIPDPDRALTRSEAPSKPNFE